MSSQERGSARREEADMIRIAKHQAELIEREAARLASQSEELQRRMSSRERASLQREMGAMTQAAQANILAMQKRYTDDYPPSRGGTRSTRTSET
jgi:hypothetical protein